MYESYYMPRIQSRYRVKAPIIYSEHDTDGFLPANMINISDGGMCFESQYEVNPQADVCIWLEKKVQISLKDIQVYNFYRSRVLWCREINKGSGLGIGVQHVNKAQSLQIPEFTCSLCEKKKVPPGKVYFIKDFIYLCPECYERFKHFSPKSRDEILRLLEGNIF